MAVFQSTHPVWDATKQNITSTGLIDISIHASRMGCDPPRIQKVPCSLYFNPRIPYGMRHINSEMWFTFAEFQSTHPVWDATCPLPPTISPAPNFNPRIPYGMRPRSTVTAICSRNFNPRIPYGMRRLQRKLARQDRTFQSTHPVWDATTTA